MTCGKNGFGWTVYDDASEVAVDHEISAPPSLASRGAELAWLLEEAERVFGRPVESLGLQAAGGGQFAASPERIEVGGLVQVAAHRAGVPCTSLTRDQVRSKLGEPHGKGAYERLLERPDVAERSNKDRRDRYLLALAALR
jgi:hypothetical protein